MLEEILPATAVVEEAWSDLPDAPLLAGEEAVLGNAVESRRREFATARMCARRALARLALPAQPVLAGQRGEPRWPEGVVGSITHCRGYRACAVARVSDLLTVGIDAEPHGALAGGVLEAIASAPERAHLRALGRSEPQTHWDRLLFSAKEAVYKAWYPLTERRLSFEHATLTFDPARCAFAALVPVASCVATGRGGPAGGLAPAEELPCVGGMTALRGRWLIRHGLLMTAVAIEWKTVGAIFDTPPSAL